MPKIAIQSIKEQIQRYAVALISLVVALTSLSYNTWRNEQTEANRNIRAAGFEMIIAMADLHEAVFFGHYARQTSTGNEKKGWAVVLGLEDLSMVMPVSVQNAAKELHKAWQDGSGNLGKSEESLRQINQAIDGLRQEILLALKALE